MDELAILNTIRAIAFCSVVLGHSYFHLVLFSSNILQTIPNLRQEARTALMGGLLYAVDAFFFIGGFFVAYVMTN